MFKLLKLAFASGKLKENEVVLTLNAGLTIGPWVMQNAAFLEEE